MIWHSFWRNHFEILNICFKRISLESLEINFLILNSLSFSIDLINQILIIYCTILSFKDHTSDWFLWQVQCLTEILCYARVSFAVLCFPVKSIFSPPNPLFAAVNLENGEGLSWSSFVAFSKIVNFRRSDSYKRTITQSPLSSSRLFSRRISFLLSFPLRLSFSSCSRSISRALGSLNHNTEREKRH